MSTTDLLISMLLVSQGNWYVVGWVNINLQIKTILSTLSAILLTMDIILKFTLKLCFPTNVSNLQVGAIVL